MVNRLSFIVNPLKNFLYAEEFEAHMHNELWSHLSPHFPQQHDPSQLYDWIFRQPTSGAHILTHRYEPFPEHCILLPIATSSKTSDYSSPSNYKLLVALQWGPGDHLPLLCQNVGWLCFVYSCGNLLIALAIALPEGSISGRSTVSFRSRHQALTPGGGAFQGAPPYPSALVIMPWLEGVISAHTTISFRSHLLSVFFSVMFPEPWWWKLIKRSIQGSALRLIPSTLTR